MACFVYMHDFEDLCKQVIAFRDVRNWKQFHNPKDLALSLVLEATEVMEHFQWKSNEETEDYLKNHKHKEGLGEELADVLNYLLLMSHELDINLLDALDKKLRKNEEKYPVEKAKGNHTKYNKL